MNGQVEGKFIYTHGGFTASRSVFFANSSIQLYLLQSTRPVKAA